MRAARWVKAWDSHGIHRTATDGDWAGAEWLMCEVRQLGAAPVIEEFAVERLDPIAAFLEINGTRVEGVPIFDASATGAGGVSGSVGLIGSTAVIGVVELSPHAVYAPDYEKLRRNSRHEAVVILCNGTRSGMALLNAERFSAPYGPPGIQVSSGSRDAVLAAANRGTEVRLVANSRRISSRAGNIVVTISGREPAAPTSSGHDPAQLMVAIDRRTRWRDCLLAGNSSRADRSTSRAQRDLHRQ
jgi:hypothetical protein